ncbi:maleylacetoacetate isomerase [Methylocystis parvus]|uniref:Maleylacetoacetate isomerase n=1 Tax=Methylocystis parvus TaxID=134 RepID=A0A6B8M5V4_9HYPH|nr:maleylacetoacetate isomerase [Methylocystis parvus]QGM97838.1 maleylacetoacetate isomerase [Methylocystis parvus]WBK01853.1 maleylacetoacetate isomerase [Methylocystis parvus OBBP]
MIFYDYWRSSAAFRVRICLSLKGLSVERRFVSLLRGEQMGAVYRSKNPQALVPALELDDGSVLTQSLAIIEYLESAFPRPALIPADPILAARARAVALSIACDIHPLGNLRVAEYLGRELQLGHDRVAAWRRHWIASGMTALEAMIAPAPFCLGAEPTIADACLAPQIYSAERFGVSLAAFPRIRAVAEVYAAHPAIVAAHPSAQPDAAQTAPAP